MMNNGLREMLEQMSTGELECLLRAELMKRPAEPDAVAMIMEILQKRDEAHPIEMNAQIAEAWDTYLASDTRKAVWKTHRSALRAAAVILVLGALFAIVPKQAGAKSIWDRFMNITDSIFEFFNPGDNRPGNEYVFHTDHPGLQEVYDAVVELGITEPVVPTWLPEGYELKEIECEKTRSKTEINARFVAGRRYLIYKLDLYNSNVNRKFYKDETNHKVVEHGGTKHYVIRNNDRCIAIWTRNNVECSLSTECQEDVLDEMLRSIYIMGE